MFTIKLGVIILDSWLVHKGRWSGRHSSGLSAFYWYPSGQRCYQEQLALSTALRTFNILTRDGCITVFDSEYIKHLCKYVYLNLCWSLFFGDSSEISRETEEPVKINMYNSCKTSNLLRFYRNMNFNPNHLIMMGMGHIVTRGTTGPTGPDRGRTPGGTETLSWAASWVGIGHFHDELSLAWNQL